MGVGVAERVCRNFFTVTGLSEKEESEKASVDSSPSWIDCLPAGLVTAMEGTLEVSGEMVFVLVSDRVGGDGVSSSEKSSAGVSKSSLEVASSGFFMGRTFLVGLGLIKIVGGFGCNDPAENKVSLPNGNPAPTELLAIGFEGLNSGARTLNRLFDDCCK